MTEAVQGLLLLTEERRWRDAEEANRRQKGLVLDTQEYKELITEAEKLQDEKLKYETGQRQHYIITALIQEQKEMQQHPRIEVVARSAEQNSQYITWDTNSVTLKVSDVD